MRARSFTIYAALITAAANTSVLAAQPLFDGPSRWFPSYAPVHAVAAWPRSHRTGAFAVSDRPRGRRTGAFAVATHTDQWSVEVFAAEPEGDLVPGEIIPVPSHPHGVVIADLDGDDCPDIAAGGYDPPGIVLIHGRCGGTFDAPVFFPTSTPVEGVTVDDVDADGHPDLVGWSSDGGVVLLSDRARGFRAPIPLPGYYSEPIAVGRIDPDPYPDLAFANGYDSLMVRYGRGDGTFGGERRFGGHWSKSPGFAD